MSFGKLLLIFLGVGIVLCAVCGPAAVLVWGVVFVVGLTIAGEVNKTRSQEGREQMKREQQEEEDYVNYWGSTQYWDDLENEDKKEK